MECLTVVAMATNFGTKTVIIGFVRTIAIECRYCWYLAHKGRCHGKHFFGFLYMGCILAPPGEYDWTVRVWRRCGHMSNYFDHLLLYQLQSMAKMQLSFQHSDVFTSCITRPTLWHCLCVWQTTFQNVSVSKCLGSWMFVNHLIWLGSRWVGLAVIVDLWVLCTVELFNCICLHWQADTCRLF